MTNLEKKMERREDEELRPKQILEKEKIMNERKIYKGR